MSVTECDVVIVFYSAVPSHPGLELIRLPRCARCYDETHDYSFGHAYCIPAELTVHRHQQEYKPMTCEQLTRWQEAEQEEQARREAEAK